MTVELHIYGSAFGLPSIDVKCLAAIALLQSCLAAGSWTLVASNDPLVSPFEELPALKCSNQGGHIWVTGYRNIASYIQAIRYSDVLQFKEDVNFKLDDGQQADAEACLSFLESRGLPLLDLSLYVSSDNYTTATRLALTDLLSWPQSWIVPQKLRDAARKRSEHLGLSGLDVDAVREKELQKENEGISAAIPKSLRTQKKSVTSLLGSSAEQTRFRLQAVTADFFEPLEEQLGKRPWFIGDQMTILDSFALAILSQMLAGELPQPWLGEALEKYPKLYQWTIANRDRIFVAQDKLPWRCPAPKPWTRLIHDVVDSLAESMPITIIQAPIRTARSKPRRLSDNHEPLQQSVAAKYQFQLQKRNHRLIVREVMAGCFSSAGLVALMAYMGILTWTWPTFRKPQAVRQGFGEAGALLGLR